MFDWTRDGPLPAQPKKCFKKVPTLSVGFKGDDLDQTYDSISAFSSGRNNHEAVFGEEENMKDNKPATIGDFNRAELFYSNRSAIQLPPIAREEFAIHPAYYNLVSRGKFRGHFDESPLDHLEVFEDLVSSIKADGVQADYHLCKLFPHSLAGRGTSWLRQLEPGSLTNWSDTKNAFMIHFLDDSVTKLLREKISSFSQAPTEGLKYRLCFDDASNGNFMTKTPTEASVLVNNAVTSLSTKEIDYDRRKFAEASDNHREEQGSTRIASPPRKDRAQTSSIPVAEKASMSIDTSGCRSTPIDLDGSVFPLSCGYDTFTEEEELLPDGVERHPPHVDRHQYHIGNPVLTFDRAGSMPHNSEIPEMHCMGIMDEILLQLPPVDIEKLSPSLQSDMIRDDAPEKQDDKTKIMVVSEQVQGVHHPYLCPAQLTFLTSLSFPDYHNSRPRYGLKSLRPRAGGWTLAVGRLGRTNSFRNPVLADYGRSTMPLKRSRGRESVEEEGRSLGLSSRRYDLRERVGGRCVRTDVAECSRVMSETRSSDTVADFGLAGIAAMSEREDVHIGDGMMIDSDCEDDCVITGVRTVEQELAPKGHEIVMVHDYVTIVRMIALNPYSAISYESDPDEDEDPPVSPYVPEAIDHSHDSPFALLWEGTSPIFRFAADMRADAILTFYGGSTSGI
ncbi:Retrotransposon gag domain [Arabidopsis suecica]|uniref:Retrotransposon gag domain n=1 Tax=Arabidopsis suecica TaxID=45249 RepID=A0A8T1XBG2_ARASU|nr:Retrotransposon gag domain [Arabidopsis suecica]